LKISLLGGCAVVVVEAAVIQEKLNQIYSLYTSSEH